MRVSRIFRAALAGVCAVLSLSGPVLSSELPANLDLASEARDFTSTSAGTIQLGNGSRTVGIGDAITASEAIALTQVGSGPTPAPQPLLLNNAGASSGGQFSLPLGFSPSALNIPSGITMTQDFSVQETLNIAGALSNAGVISTLGGHATISANTIDNMASGIIQSLTPGLNLSLIAAQTVTNAGVIQSQGNLNITSMAGSIQNSGSMIAAATLAFATSATQNLVINNFSGADLGSVHAATVTMATVTPGTNLAFLGGILQSQSLMASAPDGICKIHVEELTGSLDLNASRVYVGSYKPFETGPGFSLVGLDAETAVIYSIGDIVISTPLVVPGGELSLIASGDIVSGPGAGAISTASTTGGAITMDAGAQPFIFDSADPFSRPTFGPFGSTTLGGGILLRGANPISSFETSSSDSSSRGGSITLIVYPGEGSTVADSAGAIIIPLSTVVRANGGAGFGRINITADPDNVSLVVERGASVTFNQLPARRDSGETAAAGVPVGIFAEGEVPTIAQSRGTVSQTPKVAFETPKTQASANSSTSTQVSTDNRTTTVAGTVSQADVQRRSVPLGKQSSRKGSEPIPSTQFLAESVTIQPQPSSHASAFVVDIASDTSAVVSQGTQYRVSQKALSLKRGDVHLITGAHPLVVNVSLGQIQIGANSIVAINQGSDGLRISNLAGSAVKFTLIDLETNNTKVLATEPGEELTISAADQQPQQGQPLTTLGSTHMVSRKQAIDPTVARREVALLGNSRHHLCRAAQTLLQKLSQQRIAGGGIPIKKAHKQPQLPDLESVGTMPLKEAMQLLRNCSPTCIARAMHNASPIAVSETSRSQPDQVTPQSLCPDDSIFSPVAFREGPAEVIAVRSDTVDFWHCGSELPFFNESGKLVIAPGSEMLAMSHSGTAIQLTDQVNIFVKPGCAAHIEVLPDGNVKLRNLHDSSSAGIVAQAPGFACTLNIGQEVVIDADNGSNTVTADGVPRRRLSHHALSSGGSAVLGEVSFTGLFGRSQVLRHLYAHESSGAAMSKVLKTAAAYHLVTRPHGNFK